MSLAIPGSILSLGMADSVAGSTISGCVVSCINGVCENSCADGDSDKQRGDGVKVGNGDVISKPIDAEGFSEITARSMEVSISHGKKYSVVVKADSNLFEDVVVKLNGKRLDVSRRDGAYRNDTMKVLVSLPRLSKASNIGAHSISISGFEQPKLALENEGTGSINLQDSDFDTLRYSGHGNSTLNAENSKIESAELDVTGVGEVNLAFEGSDGEISGSIEGVSSVYYCGNPTVKLERSGITTVEKRQCR